MDKDEQALLLLTNRVLFDWMSLSIDRGLIDKAFALRLIDFSGNEVKKGAPALSAETDALTAVFKSRFPQD